MHGTERVNSYGLFNVAYVNYGILQLFLSLILSCMVLKHRPFHSFPVSSSTATTHELSNFDAIQIFIC